MTEAPEVPGVLFLGCLGRFGRFTALMPQRLRSWDRRDSGA